MRQGRAIYAPKTDTDTTGWIELPDVLPTADSEFYVSSLDPKDGYEENGKWMLNPVVKMTSITPGRLGWERGGMYEIYEHILYFILEYDMHVVIDEDKVKFENGVLLHNMTRKIREVQSDVIATVQQRTANAGDTGAHWSDLYSTAKQHITEATEFTTVVISEYADVRGDDVDSHALLIVEKYEEYQVKVARVHSACKRARLAITSTDYDELNMQYITAMVALKETINEITGR